MMHICVRMKDMYLS